uniref:Uncharacterized protein n=1 Tax=Medicago truncatula TaxID=3880 RepID=I3S525_MEDTR|nr:unknown [Medicago truncatula]
MYLQEVYILLRWRISRARVASIFNPMESIWDSFQKRLVFFLLLLR